MGKILIIADVTEKCFATPRGLQLAAKLGLDAEVVAFTHVSMKGLGLKSAAQVNMRRQLLGDRERVVAARIEKYRQPDQEVTLKVVWDKDIHSWVNKRCAKQAYVAVVKTGHRSESLLHTCVDWQLLRECPVPVLIVAARRWHRSKPVLACLDLASTVATKRKLNHKVLERARDLAAALGVELQILSAIEVPTLLTELDLIDAGTYARDAKAQMQPHIRELAEAFGLAANDFHCKRGPVAKVISSQASKLKAQLVVMGTVGRSGVKGRLLGNTAEQVLRHLKTDVLAIKP